MSIDSLTDLMISRSGTEEPTLERALVQKTARLYAENNPLADTISLYNLAAYDAWEFDGKVMDRGHLWGEHLLHGSAKIHQHIQLMLNMAKAPDDVQREISLFLDKEDPLLGPSYALKTLYCKFTRKPEHAEVRKVLQEVGIATDPETQTVKDFWAFIAFIGTLEYFFYDEIEATSSSSISNSILHLQDKLTAEYILKAYCQSVSAILSHYSSHDLATLQGDREFADHTDYENARYLVNNFQERLGHKTTFSTTFGGTLRFRSPEDRAAIQRLPGLVPDKDAILLPKGMIPHSVTEVCILYLGLKKIPEEIVQLRHVECLEIGGMPLEEIDPLIEGMESLRELTISYTRVKSIPKELIRLKLRRLDLSGNYIKHLPHEIGEMTELTELDVHNNKIEELPDVIPKIPTLHTLHLSDNPIQSLPDTFRDSGIKKLYLASSKISALPPSLLETQLTHLNVDRTPLVGQVPQEFIDMETLRVLTRRSFA